ncbi:SGNH/GDSL hydrolase family protein [Marivivens marinus]|uniref:SGNH/GDSL hydrolase family protein n=1 Tax=Marivivens marinus TaxID=3110173 RepID=UPI003B8486DE
MPTILTFGDSNTHGTPPMPSADVILRLGPTERWPRVMAQSLGAGWELVEEGLGGRTTVFDDPETGPLMNGGLALPMALRSHGPIDWLTIMLGTNDCQFVYGLTAEQIAAGLARLLVIANRPDLQARHGGFRVLVIAPPPVEEVGTFGREFHMGAAKSQALPALYARLARDYGAEFMNAGDHIAISPVDGVHFDAAAHRTLGLAVADKILSF